MRPEAAVDQRYLDVGTSIARQDGKISRVRLDRNDSSIGMKMPEAQRLDANVGPRIDNHANRILSGIPNAVSGIEEMRQDAFVRLSTKDNAAAKSPHRKRNSRWNGFPAGVDEKSRRAHQAKIFARH